MDSKVRNALNIAFALGQTDGSHHKAWVINLMVKTLLETPQAYAEWVAEYENNGEYEWDVGVAP